MIGAVELGVDSPLVSADRRLSWRFFAGPESSKANNSTADFVFKFIHSFIPDISIVPLQVHYYSEVLPTTSLIAYCVRVKTQKRYRQLQAKDLSKVPTWQLEWDSNLRPSRRKTLSLPLNHHDPQMN